MYLLDTNVVSLLDSRSRPEAGPFVDWARRNDRLISISTITLTEIETGILTLLRKGKRQRAAQITKLRDGIIADYGRRLLPLDVSVALAVARIGEAVRPMVIERNYPPPCFSEFGCQVAIALRMVWNERTSVRRRAVSTTVRTSASPFAAHMAR